jgi:hypothetical protein
MFSVARYFGEWRAFLAGFEKYEYIRHNSGFRLNADLLHLDVKDPAAFESSAVILIERCEMISDSTIDFLALISTRCAPENLRLRIRRGTKD